MYVHDVESHAVVGTMDRPQLASSPQTSSSLLAFIWANRRMFFPGMLLALGRIVMIAPFPIIVQHMLDQAMPARDVPTIVGLSALMVGLLAVHQVLSVQGALRLGRAVTMLSLHLRATIFHKLQDLSFSYLDRQKTGALLAKYAFDTQKIDAVILPIVNGFVPDAFYSVLTLSILIALNWQLALVVVLVTPVITFMRTRYFARLRLQHEANRVAQERMTGAATEALGALRLVRSYGEEQQMFAQLDRRDREVAQARVALIGVSSGFGAFSFSMIKLLSLIVVAGGALLSIMGTVSAGTVIAFVAGLPSLVQPIQMFTQLSDQYFLGAEAFNSVNELLDESDTEPWQGTTAVHPLTGRIAFDQVSFHYAGAERPALHEFSLGIAPGEKIALVGASGAGKTTVTGLLLGFYAPTSGQILIDGVPQAALDMRWFRQNTALVMQDSILLSGSVADNIRFGRPTASDMEVRAAARLAQADEFIQQLPNGFETVVGERGMLLSGGQRQRLSIARALLRNPAVLILDEPTSALDYESEQLIQTALDTLAKGRTVITIAHRLSTIRSADRVIVLDGGRIVEQGSFAELWAHGGYFRRMLLAQGLLPGSDDQAQASAS